MKTAIQQLIEHLSPEQHGIRLLAEALLEKEKEQIIAAYGSAVVEENKSDYIGMNEEFLAKEYYNQTYNNYDKI